MAPRLFEPTPVTVAPTSRAPQPAVLPQHTTSAMQAFQCLAERCEDTCCRDWAVPINRDDLDRMKSMMSTTPEGRERLVRLVVIGNHARAADGLAQLQMDETSACPMLEHDNRCGVHTAFGEQALSTPCSVFPRTALAVHDHLEVGGSLGCPEVARLMLLSEEPLRMRPAARPLLPRAYVGKTVSADPADAYAHYFINVRDALLGCFARDLALGTQFVVAADFAERVQDFFFAETPEFQGARRTFSENRLQTEINQTESWQLHATLDQDLAALSAPGDAVTAFVASLLLDRLRLPHSPRFASLVNDVFRSYSFHSEFLAGPSNTVTQPDADQLWRLYAHRRAAFEVRGGARATAIFGNYCRHFVLRNPYTDAPTLSDYLYTLGAHLAALRFLTVGHPEVAARLSAAPDPALDHAVIDRVAVHVVQTFTKAVSHHPEFMKAAIHRSGQVTGRISFGRLVLLAKFV